VRRPMSVHGTRYLAPLVFAAAIALCVVFTLACAVAALADSDIPPSETPSNTGTLVVVGGVVIALVVASVVVLRRVALSRRDRGIQEDYVKGLAARATAAETDPLDPEESE
jgi:hypothetical protein